MSCFSDKVTKVGFEYYEAYGQEEMINMDEILSRLIEEAGRFCKKFSSDLFYQWETVRDSIKRYNDWDMLFGFRELGVDSGNQIDVRYDGDAVLAERTYLSIWKLEVSKVDGWVTANLYEVNKIWGV